MQGNKSTLLDSKNSFILDVRSLQNNYYFDLSSEQFFHLMVIRFLEKKKKIMSLLGKYDTIFVDRFDVSLAVIGYEMNLDRSLIDLCCCLKDLPVIKYIHLEIDYNEFKIRSGIEKRLYYNNGQKDELVFNKRRDLFTDLIQKKKHVFHIKKNIYDITKIWESICLSMS